MNKGDFHKMLNYLRCHPSDAQLLMSVLSGVSDNPQSSVDSYGEEIAAEFKSNQWLSAKEAGEQIGKSSTWIRRRFREGLFRSARQDDRGKYMFLKNEVLNDYNSYIMRRTTRVQHL